MNLTDKQIVRVFALCDEIAAVKQSLPKPPPGFDVSMQVAVAMRASLEQHLFALQELSVILYDDTLTT